MRVAKSAVSPDGPQPTRIFLCSCGDPDSEKYSEALEKHLAHLKRQKLIVVQQSHKILAGLVQKDEIITCVYSADIVVIFISSFLFSSDEYWEIMLRAMELRKKGQVRVIPILASPADYKGTPLKELQVLPRREKALSQMSRRSDRDEAYVEIVEEIREVIQDLKTYKNQEEEVAKGGPDSQSDSNDPAFHKAQGDMFAERQQYDKAIAAYDKAISLDPHFAAAHQAKSEVLRRIALLNYEILKRLAELLERLSEQSDDGEEDFK